MPYSIQFRPSPRPTLGVEVELQVLDSSTKELVSGVPALMETVPDEVRPYFKSELYQCCLEINTPICNDMADVERHLGARLRQALQLASALGYSLCGAGTHPFSVANRQRVTPSERYMKLMNSLQWTARQFNIFGLHVHVGIDSGEKVIALLNESALYLPHLLALSSSSPYWEGDDTGLGSVRSKIFEGLSVAGIPYAFNSWDDYSRLVNHFIATRSIKTFREIWWDVRPHPDFGTLEMRICDCPSSFEEILALVALMYTLVVKLSEDYQKGMIHRRPHAAIIKENKWRATRWGVEGEMIDPVSYRSVRIERAIRQLLEDLDGQAEKLGTKPYLLRIHGILEEGTSADRQRRVRGSAGSLTAVVQSLEDELAVGLTGAPLRALKGGQ